ncbi:MAG: phosphatase PAP2 family protein [Acetobacteraceae bacterium]|nr:phosphatase PAP2 family protein [Acetobacteraceae bacterium]
MSPILRAVTDLADQAVILPMVAAAGIALALLGWRRGALGWCIGGAITLGAVLILKLVAVACSLVVESPSGHTASAAMMAGALAWVFAARLRFALALSLAAAVAIGATRLALGLHSVPDVLVGALIGLAGALCTMQLAGPPPATLRRRALVVILLACLFSTYGNHLEAEGMIRHVAHRHGCWLYE